MSNRLKNEKSPYLLQHAENPVDWFPWSEQAFKEAEKRDCPVFLSIGYATCHWCHVMEHESFEDEEVAKLMNDAFVSIKVDREERPDIDNTYMTICQMLTGQGGWPMTIIMTPDKQPFFAATYLPKHSRARQPGMMDLIPQISEVWQQDRERVTNSIKQIKNGFSKTLELGRADEPLSPEVVNKAVQSLKSSFDEVHGGFSNAPKFPSPQNLLFLLRHAEHQNDQDALGMVEKTLSQMRMGGIWDHLGGGFHRYSTDAQWLLPHFEKMLYDQAMLMMSFADAWRITQKPLYKKTCDQIFHYLDSRMKSPEGGFYSAEDADSEGEEGKYYVWRYDEIHGILPDEDAELFCDLFEIQKSGNFRDESTRELTGKNIPHLATSITDYAAKHDFDKQDLNERIRKIRNALLEAREQRPAPLLDDKILADWNGLLMAALASAGAMFKESKYVNAAKGIETFITNHLTKKDGSLMHRFRDGEAAIDGMADDYAATIWGYIELYQATFEPEYLTKAVQLQKIFEQRFLDNEFGGFYFTSTSTEAPLGRQKEIYDGALPSSNSIAALNGFRLARLTGEMGYEYQVESLFKAFSAMINETPSGYTFALLPMLLMDHHPSEIVVTCKDDESQKQPIIEYLRSLDRFHNSVILKTGSVAESIGDISEFTQQFPIKDKPSVYVCQNFACKTPVHSLDELRRLMEDI